MNFFEIIDFIQRKVNSFLFRFLLIGYSLTIILTHENLFEGYIYAIAFILYLTFYLLLLNRGILRLLNDFVFISFCIVGKNPNEAFIFVYILLPVINSINFSGSKKSPLLYFITAAAYLSLNCYYSNSIELDIVLRALIPTLSLVFLWGIESYTSLRIKIRDFREKLNEIVDGFYTEKELLKKPYKIYSKLILLINNKIKKDLVIDLFCFTVLPIPDNKIVIVNGSKFIWHYKLNDTDLLEKFNKKQYQLNVEFSVEGKDYPYNLALQVDIENVKYIFIFTTRKMIPLYYVLIGFFRTLLPSLSKMAKILLSEKYLQEIRSEELNKLSIRSQYVTRATKAMHYIRNRLGPVNNLIKMIDTSNTVSEGKQQNFLELLNSEKERAKIELQHIIERANYLLEKSNNPFNFIQTEQVSLNRLFSILRRNVNTFFPSIDIAISFSNLNENCFVEINDEGFEIFLSDWLSNIKKYYNGTVLVNFNISDGFVTIDFSNDYQIDEADVNRLISDLMSDDRNEIMKRTTHGLFQIKTSLEEMNIDYKIEKISEGTNLIRLTIVLKLIENEDSNF